MTTKKLFEETEQKEVTVVKTNPTEVITFLHRHLLAIFLKVYL